MDGSMISYTPFNGEKQEQKIKMPTHHEAISAVMDFLTNQSFGVISAMSEVDAVGHRVVHGGEYFSQSVMVTDEVLEKIELCSDLAPLHNPANLIGIQACMEIMPDTPNVVVFDTAFHQTMPESAYLYAIPRKYYEQYQIRRYGFHGTSHSFVSKRTAEILKKDPRQLKTIVCHLGNGASISAVEYGKSVDTSMGLTPLAGVIMGTRSGDIDPGILGVIAEKEGISVEQVIQILNKESGVAGLSELSSDFRDINKAMQEGNQKAASAFYAYIQSVVRFIGAYIAVMNGVDAIVFTAGVGENNPNIRKAICEHFSFLGIQIDDDANNTRGREVILSTADSKVKVLVVPTNEELAIARETVEVLSR